jgi:hypothetical protein
VARECRADGVDGEHGAQDSYGAAGSEIQNRLRG